VAEKPTRELIGEDTGTPHWEAGPAR